MLKPIDIVAALALVGLDRDEWTYASLAQTLAISTSAAHRAVDQLTRSGLFDDRGGRVRARALHELLTHAVKYLCPAQVGPRTRGIPTGPFAEPLASAFGLSGESEGAWVWPHWTGTAAGAAFEPLHPNVPTIALNDERLRRRFAVVDALRAGRAREVRLADEWLRRELGLELSA